jgi:hypothetical protein
MTEQQQPQQVFEPFCRLKLTMGNVNAPVTFEWEAPSHRYHAGLNEVMMELPELIQRLTVGQEVMVGESNVRFTVVSTTATESDGILVCDATAGNIIVSLPTATLVGKRLVVVKSDNSVNTVSVTAFGNDMIEGGASKTLTSQFQKVALIANGVSMWLDEGTGLQ